MNVVPAGAHHFVESDGADHAAGDLPAGEIRPVKDRPLSPGDWPAGPVDPQVPPSSPSGCTAPGAPSGFGSVEFQG